MAIGHLEPMAQVSFKRTYVLYLEANTVDVQPIKTETYKSNENIALLFYLILNHLVLRNMFTTLPMSIRQFFN